MTARYPTGKGLLVWIISRCAGGDPARLAEMARAAGLDWVAFKVHDGSGDYNGDLRPTRMRSARAASPYGPGGHPQRGPPPAVTSTGCRPK